MDEYPLTTQIQEDRIVARLFRKFYRAGEILTGRTFKPLPESDKQCAELFWSHVQAGRLVLEFNPDLTARVRPGPQLFRGKVH